MATIAAMRDGLQTRLETLSGVRATQEWAGPMNVSGSASVAVIEKAATEYDTVMNGQGDAVNFRVTMLVSKVSDRTGRDKLDAFCDPTSGSTTSVRTAVNGTLGSIVAFATVVSDSEYREYSVPGDTEAYLGCEFMVQVAT